MSRASKKRAGRAKVSGGQVSNIDDPKLPSSGTGCSEQKNLEPNVDTSSASASGCTAEALSHEEFLKAMDRILEENADLLATLPAPGEFLTIEELLRRAEDKKAQTQEAGPPTRS